MNDSTLRAAILEAVGNAHLAPTASDVASWLRIDLITAASALAQLHGAGQLRRERRNNTGPYCYRLATGNEPRLDGTVEGSLRFAVWAGQLRNPLTPALIMTTFGCSRATAYRYCSAWRGAVKPSDGAVRAVRA